MKPTQIPTHQDDPQWIIIWPIDELLPVVACGCVGILMSQAAIMLAIGYLVSRAYHRAKDTKPNGFVEHWAYSKGVSFCRSKTMKNTFNRRFIPD